MLSERGIVRLIGKWKRRFNLDWRISVRVTSQAVFQETHGEGSFIYGDCYRIPEKRKATIRICDPSVEGVSDSAVEETVIHELGHILLDPTGRMDGDSAFETGLTVMAKAMATGWRK